MRFIASLVIFGFLLCAGPSSAQLSSSGAGCAVSCGAGGGSGIFTITNIGSNGAASPSIGSVTVPGGATVIVEVTDQGTTVGTLSDGHNTYSLVKSVNLNNSGASGTLGIFASQNVAALSSATLSYTPNGTSANMSAIYVTTALGTVAIDTAATASNFGNSTSPTITSGAPTFAGELFLAGVAQTSNSSIAQAGGWVTPFNSVTTENPPLFGGNQTNPGTSAATFTPGGGTSNPWGTVVTAVFSSCSQATTLLSRLDGLENSTAVSTLICGMVADGTFQLLDGMDVFAINSTANALQNWISTAVSPIVTNGSCTFNANQGYTGDGSSCWFATGFIPANGGNMTQNSASFGVCVLTSRAGKSNTVEIGVSDNTSNIYFNPRIGSNFTSHELNGASFPGPASSNSQGSWAVTRTSSTTINLYRNGSSVASGESDTSTGLGTHPISIFAFNPAGGPEEQFSSDQLGFVFWGGGLTATQVTNIYNRLHTYMTTIGAPSGC